MCPESEPVPVISPESASQSPPVVSRDCSIRRIKSPENVSCTIASPGTSEGDKMLSEVAPPQIVQDAYPRSEIKSPEPTSEIMSVELPKCVSVAPEEKSSECTNLDSPRSVSKPTSECTQIDFPNSAKVMPKPTSECIQLDSPKSAKVMPQPTSSECNQIESPKLVNVVSVPVPSKNSQVESSKSADALSEPGSVVIIQVKSPEISNVALPEPECSESVQMECSNSDKALSEPTSPENNPVATPPSVTISSQPISSETIQVESQVLNKVVLSDSILSESTQITSPPSTKVVSEAPTIESVQVKSPDSDTVLSEPAGNSSDSSMNIQTSSVLEVSSKYEQSVHGVSIQSSGDDQKSSSETVDSSNSEKFGEFDAEISETFLQLEYEKLGEPKCLKRVHRVEEILNLIPNVSNFPSISEENPPKIVSVSQSSDCAPLESDVGADSVEALRSKITSLESENDDLKKKQGFLENLHVFYKKDKDDAIKKAKALEIKLNEAELSLKESDIVREQLASAEARLTELRAVNAKLDQRVRALRPKSLTGGTIIAPVISSVGRSGKQMTKKSVRSVPRRHTLPGPPSSSDLQPENRRKEPEKVPKQSGIRPRKAKSMHSSRSAAATGAPAKRRRVTLAEKNLSQPAELTLGELDDFNKELNNAKLILRNLDAPWKDRHRSLNALELIVRETGRLSPELLINFKDGLQVQISELRSFVVKCACQTLTTIAEVLKGDFAPVLGFYIEVLFTRLYIAVKVIREACEECVNAIVIHTRSVRCCKELVAACKDSHPEVRRMSLHLLVYCIQMTLKVGKSRKSLQNRDPSLSSSPLPLGSDETDERKHSEEASGARAARDVIGKIDRYREGIEKSVVRCLEDANKSVRDAATLCWKTYTQKWPLDAGRASKSFSVSVKRNLGGHKRVASKHSNLRGNASKRTRRDMNE
eukprot:210063_1